MSANDISDTKDQTLTVYYDGSCPVCSREINWYKNRRATETITWQDVSKENDSHVACDLQTNQAMERFHVRRSDGTLVSGAAAFSELWSSIPALKVIGFVTKLPVVRSIAEAAYKVFLYFRSRRQ